MEDQDKKMAVLIDAENISYRYAKIILDEASNYGPLIYKRIYGDWSSPTMAPWRNLILNYSIQPIQQFANTRGKNATDSALIIDAMDLLHAGKPQGFCIVGRQRNKAQPLGRRLRSGDKIPASRQRLNGVSFLGLLQIGQHFIRHQAALIKKLVV